MKEIRGLTVQQHRALRCAINRGYLDTYEEDPRAWKHTFIGAFLWKWPKRTKTLSVLSDMLGHEPTWDDFTEENISDIPDEMASTGISANSIRTLCNEIKAVLNANHKRIPAEDFNKALVVKREASQHVYLTDKEVARFLSYKPKTYAERFAHRNFVVELLTGARLCDAVKLTMHNCNINTGTLSYVPDKTSGVVVTVPIDERRHLRDYLSIKLPTDIHLATYNATVREICRKLKITTKCTIFKDGQSITDEKWKFVSSHTARRSFATNLYLEGVTLEDIALMMGHGKNIETTKRYICAERKVTSKIMAYFLPEDDYKASAEYSRAYNDAITDALDLLEASGTLSPDNIIYRSIQGLQK